MTFVFFQNLWSHHDFMVYILNPSINNAAVYNQRLLTHFFDLKLLTKSHKLRWKLFLSKVYVLIYSYLYLNLPWKWIEPLISLCTKKTQTERKSIKIELNQNRAKAIFSHFIYCIDSNLQTLQSSQNCFWFKLIRMDLFVSLFFVGVVLAFST